MAAQMTVYVFAQQSDIITGIWCPECMVPSGTEVPIGRITEEGVTLNFTKIRQCRQCGAAIPEGPTILIRGD